MATKNRNDFGDFDFDSSLDFDFDPKPAKAGKAMKKDKPIDHIVDGVRSSMKSKFTDPYHLRSMMRKALPNGFGAAWDAVDTVATDAQQLYDEATKEVRPFLGQIAKNIDRLTPDSATRAKRFTRQLREKLSPEVESSYENHNSSAEDSGVERLLAEFDASQDARDQANRHSDHVRRLVEDRISAKRFDAQHKVLGIIANETAGVRNYLTTFNVSYQRKSLELQFRSYTAMANLLNNFNKFAKDQREFQEALLLNTSLPEYAKTSNVQRWKQISKEQVFGGLNEKLFGQSRVKLAGQRLLKRGRESLSEMKDGMSLINEALESALEAREIGEMAAEMEGKKYSGWRSVGNFSGDMLGEFISDMISSRLKTLAEKNPGIMKRSMQVGRYAFNPGALLAKGRNSKFYKGLGSKDDEISQMLHSGLGGLMSLFAAETPDMNIKGVRIGSEGENKLHTQMRAQRSLAEVIPGYLARILREVTVLRTGDNKTALTVYDSRSGRFKSEGRMAADLVDSFRKAAKETVTDKTTYGEEIERLFGVFAGKDSKITGDKKIAIQQFLANLARTNADMDFDPDSIRNSAEYKALDKSTKASVNGLLRSRFSGDDLRGNANRFRLTESLTKTRSSMGSLHGIIQTAIRDGYGEMLEQAGVIKPGKDDSYDIDEKAYYEFYDSVFAKSDINVKENIRPVKFDGKRSLDAINKTPVSDWNYKPGMQYGPHTYRGPMAQDVRKNFGDKVAPGGKQIDLVSMNGHTMAAVQKLSEMVESMGAGDGIKYLSSIDARLKAIHEEGGMGGGGSSSGPGFSYKGNGLAGAAGHLFAGLLDKAGSYATGIGKGAIKVADGVVDAADSFWKSNKEEIKQARDMAIQGAVFAATKAAKMGSDLIFTRIPNMFNTAKGIGRSMIDTVKGMLQQARDIHIPGIPSPVIEGVLLEAGFYRDKATDKILRTMDDVMRAQGDIVDQFGRVRLSAMDRARGIYDGSGKKITSFARQAAGVAVGLGVLGAQKLKGMFDRGAQALGNLGGMGKSALDSVSGMKNRIGDTLRNGVAGISGISGDSRVVPVLIQIRDILALGKRGKGIKEIMSRELPDGSSGSSFRTNDESSPEQTNTSILSQIRDFAAIGKPASAVDAVAKNAENAKSFFDQPIFGGRAKAWFEKLKQFSQGETQDSPVPEMAGPAPEMMGPQLPAAATQPSTGGLMGIGKSIGSIFGSGKKIGGDLLDRFGKRFPGASGRMGGMIGRAKGSRLGRWVGDSVSAVSGIAGNIASGVGGLFGEGNNPAQAAAAAADGTNNYSATSHASRLLALGRDRLLRGYRSVKGAFGDRNGDGERDGGAADQMADTLAHQQANAERKAASIEASRKAAMEKAGKFAPDQDALEKVVGMAAKVMAGIADTVTGAVGEAADILGDGIGDGPDRGKGGGKGGRPGTGKRGVFRRALSGIGKGLWKATTFTGKAVAAIGGAGITAARTVGTGILSVGSKIPGLAKVGRVAMMAARAASVAGMAAGGGAGMLTAAAGFIGSALASPVVIGAAAIAGMGYGGYKLYKYVTRNSLDDWERIRVIQYGLDGTSATEAFNSKIKALEGYLLDGKIGYSSGRPYINSRSVDPNDIRELFDISEKDTEQASKFSSWYTERFQPVFLHHVATIYRVSPKIPLNKVDSLETSEKLSYLAGIEIDTIWDKSTSPFKGLDVLGNDASAAKKLIDAKIQTLGKEVQKKAKNELKTNDGPRGADAVNAGKPVVSVSTATAQAANDVLPHDSRTVLPKRNAPVIPVNSRLGRQMAANGGGEDGAKPPEAGQTGTVSMSSSGASSTLRLASGSISDGQSGMQHIALGKNAVLEGMHPRLKKHLLGMAQEYGEATGRRLHINEAFRSFKRQEQLYRQNPGKAAPPGRSLHEFGLALDLNTKQLDELDNMGLLRKYGFTRPIRGETWHIEPAGIQSGIQRAKTDAAFADAAIASSLGRGGGGVGSKPSRVVGGRDPDMARRIYETAGGVGVDLKSKDGAPAATAASLQAPMVNGQPTMSNKDIQAAAGPGYASIGRGDGVQFSGNMPSAAASLGDGTGKYDKVKADIAKYAAEAGADPNRMMMLAAMENSLKPSGGNANSSAGGMMQFIDGTWKEQLGKHGSKYGLERDTPKNDMRASTILAAEYMKSNTADLRKKHGNLSFTEEYMTHFLGKGGATTLLNAGNDAIAARLLPTQAASNRETFYHPDGRPRTVGEMRAFLDDKIARKAKQFGINLDGTKAPGVATPSTSSSGPIPYTPTFQAAENKLPLTGNVGMPEPLGLLTAKPDAATKAPGVGFESPAPVFRAPSAGGFAAKPLDTSIQMTADIFSRLNEVSGRQVTHLENIDANTAKLVPLLEKVVENTNALSSLPTGNKPAQETPKSSGPSSNGLGQGQKRMADASSFDNQRRAA